MQLLRFYFTSAEWKEGERCSKDFGKINEVFYINQEQKHPKINIKSSWHITQLRRSVSELPSVDAASVEIYLGHVTENGQWTMGGVNNSCFN